ncbi:MAG: elongation factor P [Parcubacteria group bacterium]|nr:elongation factor P [Parcubacteria group bacterium]
MLSPSDLKIGTLFIIDNEPYEVLDSRHVLLGRGRGHYEIRIKNLKTGAVFQKSFRTADSFPEADINYRSIKYLYNHRNEFWFSDPNKPSERFFLSEEKIGDLKKFLKTNAMIEAVIFNNEIINIDLPIKMDFKVIEAPPGVRGDSSKSGAKVVKIETGAEINAPLFIEEGDVIKINTQSGQYVERVEKRK